MAIDEQEIVGKWNISFRGRTGSWKWEYTFSADGTVKWRDPLNNMTGSGRWLKQGKLINIAWNNSRTKESWYCPISPRDQKGWIDASYGVGAFSAQKVVETVYPQPTDPSWEVEIDVITNDPRTQPLYIDTVCEAVGYGIYNGGFYVYVPKTISEFPLLVPERMLWFGVTESARISDTIYDSQADAFAAVGGTGKPGRVAYFWGAGGKVVCPTAFTDSTTPKIINTAKYVVDELVKEVQEELIAIAIPILGGMIGRGIMARIMRARTVGTKPPPRLNRPDPAPKPLASKPYVNLNPGATTQESNFGAWLDGEAQAGRLGVIKRVRGMPEKKGAGGNPDYHLFFNDVSDAEIRNPSAAFDLRGDAVIAEGSNINNIIQNAAGSKSGSQAEVIFIEIGTRGTSGKITDEEIRAWKIGDVRTTFPKLRRLVVVRNGGGVRRSVLDLEAR